MVVVRRVLALVACVGVLAAGCGGDDDSPADDGRSPRTSTTVDGTTSTAPPATSSSTTPEAGPPPTARAAGDGLRDLGGTVQLANFYVDAAGSGAAVDAYWGTDARPDRKAATLAFGDVGGPVAARGTGEAGADGSAPLLVVSFFLRGRTTSADRIATASAEYQPGFRHLIELSWGRTFPGDAGPLRPAATQVIRLAEVGTPRAGTAAVMVNNLGVLAIGDGTPLQLAPSQACGVWPSIAEAFETGNGGEDVYEVAPGPVEVQAFDPACAAASSQLDLDVRAGDRIIVFVYGPDADSRRLLPFRVPSS